MSRSVEVAICTWNRADLLGPTLASVLATQVPDGWQRRLIVVDNNSTDATPQLIKSFCKTHTELVPLVETKQGHSRARNCAVSHSRGDLIVWTDDDVEVPGDWLIRYIEAAESNPNQSFWGAAIKPHFVAGKPDWIAENWEAVSGCFAERELGQQPVRFKKELLPYGANFALRGDLQRAFPFNTNYGRSGTALMGEDELDLMRRLIDAGNAGAWVPNNAIQHIIPVDRATTRYVWRYFVGQGRRLGLRESNRAWKLRVATHWHALRYRLAKRLHAPSPAWFAHLARWGLAQGRLNSLQTKQPN